MDLGHIFPVEYHSIFWSHIVHWRVKIQVLNITLFILLMIFVLISIKFLTHKSNKPCPSDSGLGKFGVHFVIVFLFQKCKTNYKCQQDLIVLILFSQKPFMKGFFFLTFFYITYFEKVRVWDDSHIFCNSEKIYKGNIKSKLSKSWTRWTGPWSAYY